MAGKIQSAVAECFEHKIGGGLFLWLLAAFGEHFEPFLGYRKRKKPCKYTLQGFAIICFDILRYGRDSNPRPPAWQAGILTDWTTAPPNFFALLPPVVTPAYCNLMPGSSLLSHGETPHYHRRYGVSLLSSAWGQVGPPRYCRQANSVLSDRFCVLI